MYAGKGCPPLKFLLYIHVHAADIFSLSCNVLLRNLHIQGMTYQMFVLCISVV